MEIELYALLRLISVVAAGAVGGASLWFAHQQDKKAAIDLDRQRAAVRAEEQRAPL